MLAPMLVSVKAISTFHNLLKLLSVKFLLNDTLGLIVSNGNRDILEQLSEVLKIEDSSCSKLLGDSLNTASSLKHSLLVTASL